MSGGVDSAVAALLLRDAGHEVVGVHLYCWPPKSEVEKDGLTRGEWIKKNGCRADEDKAAALKTALELGISFKTLDFSEEYNRLVVDYFYREYEAGRTPNPDVLCNSEIKFGLFLQWALANGFDYVATGHYASLTGGWLMVPKDKHKDQTYFLWKLTQKELKYVLFPLSGLTKAEVRKIAKREGLTVATRPDSQGICFVGNVDAREFLARRLKEQKGEVKNVAGELVGTHKGIWFYTIGQRGGWQLLPKAQKKYMSQGKTPIFYVISKSAKKNELVVGVGEETLSQKFEVGEVNWIAGSEPDQVPNLSVLVRIRHGGKLIPASLSGNEVTLSEPQRGIALGQSAVFYSREGEVLGGGVIN